MNDRGLLRVCGVLFLVLAVSNFLKPLEMYPDHGFVFFGQRQHGMPNYVLGPLFGVLLAIYGLGVLGLKAYALPMGRLYAGYVIVNLILFTVRMSDEALARPIFGIVYSIIAIGVSSGCVALLQRNRTALT